MKSVTVTLLALLLAVTIVSPLRDSERKIEMKDKSVTAGTPSELRKRILSNQEIRRKAESMFEASRDNRDSQKDIVIKYARWYAKNKLGYTDKQWKKVKWIWQEESDWDWEAKNPTSNAKGIAQMQTESEIPSPFRQVELGFKYIKHRYGGPDEAYAVKKRTGVY